MAVNPAWRRTREGWRRRFDEYVADPDLMGARITGIAFDYRRVTGAVDIEATLDEVIRAAGHDRAFIRRLATTALEATPPVGRRRDIEVKHRGEQAGRIDIKYEGITIITNLARVYALLSGVTENRTIERLRSAASAGVIPDQTRDDLVEAFRVLWGIRLERHVDRMTRGEAADDLVDPTELPKITERTLGGALRVIADAQERSPESSVSRIIGIDCRPRMTRWTTLVASGLVNRTAPERRRWCSCDVDARVVPGPARADALDLFAPAAHAAFPGGNGDIAFSRAIHEQSDIWIVYAGVTGTTNLTKTPHRLESQPDYDAAGTRIAYTRCTE